MTHEQIKKILNKYNIATIDELEYCLSTFDSNDECLDDPENDKKNCTNAKCYREYGVPDCRKIIEIYNKYFQKDISKKDMFVDYVEKNTSKTKSSIANYLSCKSCNQQIKKRNEKKTNLEYEEDFYINLKISDSEFKKDFCNNLSIKFDYSSLFETNYISIKQFLIREHQITSDTFVPLYTQEDTMQKDEEKRLFEIVHTSKEEFQSNLKKQENLIGSDKYIFNLASYAFNRGLVNESILLLDKLSKTSQEYSKKIEFLQLKAKVLSYQNKDKDAIEILKEIIEITKPNIDPETNNLLAASIKRDAFNEYEKYNDEIFLMQKLKESRDIYNSIYMLNKDYYPALNYIYLTFMLAHINNKDKKYIEELKSNSKAIWENTNHKIKDWWSFIANVEYLILMEKYDDAKMELKTHFEELDKEEITEFNISSTLRQLNLYYTYFCKDNALEDIIKYISNINK